MIAYLGLAVLAGAGRPHRRRLAPAPPGAAAPRLLFGLACVLFLIEDRAAPLDLVRGEADPDEVTRFLAKTPMKGGLVELPSGTVEHGNYRAMLRAADHGKPLVTAVSGFPSPIVRRIEEDERKSPIPDELLGFLEGIPTSYVLVHDSWLSPELRATHREWLGRALASGRLVFVKRFDGNARNDLYAVAKNEPEASTLEPLPWTPSARVPAAGLPWREDATLTGSIDVPAEGAVVKGPLRVSGWARIPGEDLVVTVLIDGEKRAPVTGRRLPRPDVCSVVKTLGDCSFAGYEGSFTFEPGDAGPHEILVVFRSKDGRERHYPPRRFNGAVSAPRAMRPPGRVSRAHRRHDLAVGRPPTRHLVRRGRLVPELLDARVGLPPDVPRSAPPLRREHLLPLQGHARLLRAPVGHRAPVLPRVRRRAAAAHRARPRDALRFAFSGYGAFRLARTLTGSTRPAGSRKSPSPSFPTAFTTCRTCST